jgi:DNA-directed RNA polymerase subunit M/transcription elongation factor TFIIS
MQVRIPALEDEACPKCGAVTLGKKVVVWRAADERGPHYECDACANSWSVTSNHVVTTA